MWCFPKYEKMKSLGSLKSSLRCAPQGQYPACLKPESPQLHSLGRVQGLRAWCSKLLLFTDTGSWWTETDKRSEICVEPGHRGEGKTTGSLPALEEKLSGFIIFLLSGFDSAPEAFSKPYSLRADRCLCPRDTNRKNLGPPQENRPDREQADRWQQGEQS